MNMKFKGSILTAVMLFPAVMGLTGCGKQTKGPGFTFWHTFSKKSEAKLMEVAKDFENYIYETTGKQITVYLEKFGGYDGIKDKIEKNLTVGNIPNLAVAYPDHVANYMNQGKVESGDPQKYIWKLDDFITDPQIGFGKQEDLGDDPGHPNDFFEAFIEEGTKYIEEGTYSLPFMKSTEVLYYNKTLLRHYLDGYAPYLSAGKNMEAFINSLDWDQFIELCEFVRADLNKPKSQRLVPDSRLTHVLGYDSDANMFITRLYQKGIAYSSYNKSTGKGQVDFEKTISPEAFNAVRDDLIYLRDLHQRNILITKITNGGNYSSDKFKAEETLFTVGSSGGSDYNEPTGDAFETVVTKVPAINDNAKYITQGVTLTFLKNPTESDELNMERMRYAWQFAKYITNAEVNVDLCMQSNGYFPVRKSALETETWAELLEDAGSLRAKTMNAITQQVKHRYFNSSLFKGGSELRTQMGSLLGQALIASSAEYTTIEGLITTAINTAKTYF